MPEVEIEINPIDVKVELFKRREFSFITDVDGVRHEKQHEALTILTDKKTEEFTYGGAAGGAKSWTGSSWLLFMCLAYPETKWFIGREELKRITESTLVTFLKTAKEYGCSDLFRYNGQKNFIQFNNGSRIDLLELKYLPRDQLYERFGSTEYTGGWIEEGGEINFGAYDILRTRVGRHYNDRYGIRAKIFVTCNPKKNWLFTEFYKPFVNKTLDPIKRFLMAFVQDNPFIESGYIERLKRTKDKAKKERLLKGNWDYDDSPYALCDYDNIIAIFDNDHVDNGIGFITADIARFGSDKARVGSWNGWNLHEVDSFDVSKTTDIQACIDAKRSKFKIQKKSAIADEDGIGGGVVDNCGILGFVNNSKPIHEVVTGSSKQQPNYENLQAQCLFHLADRINDGSIYISADISPTEKEEIIEELATIERDPSNTKKLSIVKKAKVKENIGRSPDWRDMLMMRVYFDLKNTGGMKIKKSSTFNNF